MEKTTTDLTSRQRTALTMLANAIARGTIVTPERISWCKAQIAAGRDFTVGWCEHTPATRELLAQQDATWAAIYLDGGGENVFETDDERQWAAEVLELNPSWDGESTPRVPRRSFERRLDDDLASRARVKPLAPTMARGTHQRGVSRERRSTRSGGNSSSGSSDGSASEPPPLDSSARREVAS